MSIIEQHQSEMLSLAYLKAISARAGLIIASFNLDYGVDAAIARVILDQTSGRRRQNGVCLRVQLKASKNWSLRRDNIIYDLEAKTFNDLTSERAAITPLVLILLCLPNTGNSRLEWHPDHLILRNCSYWWLPNPGTQATSAKSTQRIEIPQMQQVTPHSIRYLVDGLNQGYWP